MSIYEMKKFSRDSHLDFTFIMIFLSIRQTPQYLTFLSDLSEML
jgi:hypothetical protein